MTVKEFYDIAGGKYEEVLDRLMKEELILKFLIKFLADESFMTLTAALEEKDMETAFRMAHTLKGLSLNLGLHKLYLSADQLVEDLRPGEWKDFSAVVKLLEKDYNETVSAIGELRASSGG